MPTESGQAGDLTDVVITPQMVEAGLAVLHQTALGEIPLASDSLVVAELFQAMLEVSSLRYQLTG